MASAVTIRAKRREFYDEIKEKYDATDEEIVRQLVNAGHEGFNIANIKQYRIILNAYFSVKQELVKKEKIKETADKAGDWKKKIFPKPEPIPCPILDCEGTKIFKNRGSREWICSNGGRRHFNAVRVAYMWGEVNEKSQEEIDEKATHFSHLEEYTDVLDKAEAS